MCFQCSISCKTCSDDSSAVDCISCSPPKVLQKTNSSDIKGECKDLCDDGWYNLSGMCDQCHLSCKTCSDGNTTEDCTSCLGDNNVLQKVNSSSNDPYIGKCQSECNEG